MGNVVMISVGSSYPIVGTMIEEDEYNIVLEYPVAIFKDNPHIYTTQYMPFAQGGLVSFKKHNIISIANVQETIEKYYKKSVDYYRQLKPIDYEMHNGDESSEEDTEDNLIESVIAKLTKTLH